MRAPTSARKEARCSNDPREPFMSALWMASGNARRARVVAARPDRPSYRVNPCLESCPLPRHTFQSTVDEYTVKLVLGSARWIDSSAGRRGRKIRVSPPARADGENGSAQYGRLAVLPRAGQNDAVTEYW